MLAMDIVGRASARPPWESTRRSAHAAEHPAAQLPRLRDDLRSMERGQQDIAGVLRTFGVPEEAILRALERGDGDLGLGMRLAELVDLSAGG
jgi:hypothetical protein